MIAEYWDAGAWQALPGLLTYRLTHTNGCSADSFAVTFPTAPAHLRRLRAVPDLRIRDGGRICFRGVIDEVEATWADACVTTLCGRGLAARLMDNQSAGAEFFQADWAAVRDRYVLPCGVEQIRASGSWRVKLWSVGAGTSCWCALQSFCLLAGAPQPHFAPDGTLVIAPGAGRYALGENEILSAVARLCRYGVISRQEVVDLTAGRVTVASLDAAAAYGVSARHVATRAGQFTHATERSARQRIEAAAQELDTVQVVVPGVHSAQCCDTVALNLPSLGLTGAYLVREICRQFDGERETTRLMLYKRVTTL